ncbi:MAG: hypothetical protein M5U11_02245 [Anaerolineales bacterium]|jgi:hypothetical protein|nr:hypothetical protein [Anaerolineales bacterium]MDX9937106.1 hypothetical protein [Anaerolineales bacterium]GER78665.1 conserved hypothetical protein [Candidatus Denitrolinea symbiosum]
MESKNIPTTEQLERKLLGWEKWLYACFGMAVIMLAQAFLKAYENQLLVNVLFSVQEKYPVFDQHYAELSTGLISPARILFWLFLELLTLTPAAILSFHSTWRKVRLANRYDLIFGYLLAGWIMLLSLGAQDPVNVSNGYNVFALVFLFTIGLGYWLTRRKKDKAEEVFP